jgi:hypothetical protein
VAEVAGRAVVALRGNSDMFESKVDHPLTHETVHFVTHETVHVVI